MVRYSSLARGEQQYQIVSGEATLMIAEALAGTNRWRETAQMKNEELSECQYLTGKHLVRLSLNLGLNGDESPDPDS